MNFDPQRRSRIVRHWAEVAAEASWGETDQSAFAVATGRNPGVYTELLVYSYCATEGDDSPNSTILHDRASRDVREAKAWHRVAHGLRLVLRRGR